MGLSASFRPLGSEGGALPPHPGEPVTVTLSRLATQGTGTSGCDVCETSKGRNRDYGTIGTPGVSEAEKPGERQVMPLLWVSY